MADAPLPVMMWPAQAHLLGAQGSTGIVVIGITTTPTDNRTAARRQIRAALIEAVSKLTGHDATLLSVSAVPGRRSQMVASIADTDIGISIAHEAGMSVAAVNLCGSVGIDIVRLDAVTAASADWPRMAADYLGAAAAARIDASPSAQRGHQFAIEWAAQEARLKCDGHALVEWDAAPASVTRLIVQPLALPHPWIGALAMPPRQDNFQARVLKNTA